MYLLEYMYRKNTNISQIRAPCPKIDTQNLEIVMTPVKKMLYLGHNIFSVLNLRLAIGSHLCWELLYCRFLLCDVMHWRFAKSSEVSIPKRHTKQVQKQFFIYWANKKQSSHHSAMIVLGRYPSSHGELLLVRGTSIFLLLLSKGASVFKFWWHVLYDTKNLPFCFFCVVCS